VSSARPGFCRGGRRVISVPTRPTARSRPSKCPRFGSCGDESHQGSRPHANDHESVLGESPKNGFRIHAWKRPEKSASRKANSSAAAQCTARACRGPPGAILVGMMPVATVPAPLGARVDKLGH